MRRASTGYWVSGAKGQLEHAWQLISTPPSLSCCCCMAAGAASSTPTRWAGELRQREGTLQRVDRWADRLTTLLRWGGMAVLRGLGEGGGPNTLCCKHMEGGWGLGGMGGRRLARVRAIGLAGGATRGRGGWVPSLVLRVCLGVGLCCTCCPAHNVGCWRSGTRGGVQVAAGYGLSVLGR